MVEWVGVQVINDPKPWLFLFKKKHLKSCHHVLHQWSSEIFEWM